MYHQNCLQKYKCEQDLLRTLQELYPGERTWPQEYNLQGQLGMDTEEPVCSFKEKPNTPKAGWLNLYVQWSLSFTNRYINKICPYFELLISPTEPGYTNNLCFKKRRRSGLKGSGYWVYGSMTMSWLVIPLIKSVGFSRPSVKLGLKSNSWVLIEFPRNMCNQRIWYPIYIGTSI